MRYSYSHLLNSKRGQDRLPLWVMEHVGVEHVGVCLCGFLKTRNAAEMRNGGIVTCTVFKQSCA